MKYPNFLKTNDTIGVIAPSCGSNVNPYRYKTMQAIKYFESLGYKIKRGHRVYANYNATSAKAIIRGHDFMSMYQNKHVNFIWSTGGGELMINMLPFVNFEKIKKLPPKFFMGFSDNTNLTFTLTTIADVATIYAHSLGDFAYEKLNDDVIDTYKLITNQSLSFSSYQYYYGPISKENNVNLKINESLNYKDLNIWKSLNDNKFTIQGRIIGGCLDCLVCLCGTKYDNVVNFIEKYKEDGFIWYFDVCDLTSTGLYRALFQLINANWLKYCKAILIGRIGNNNVILNYSFLQAIKDALEQLNVYVLYDVDISHISPSMPILNGAIATISYENNKGTISYKLK